MSNKKVTGGVEIVAAVDYRSQVPGPKDAPVRRQLNEESVNISSAGKQMTRAAPAKEQNNTTPIPWRPCWPASRSSIRPTRRVTAMAPHPPGPPVGGQRPAMAMAPPAVMVCQWCRYPVRRADRSRCGAQNPGRTGASGGGAPEPAKPKARPAAASRLPSPQRDQEMEGCARRWPASASCWSTRSPA